MSREKDSVAHLVGLSEFKSISIDDGVAARDKWSREDKLPLKDPAILRIRLVSDGLLLDMTIVRKRTRSSGVSSSSHDELFRTFKLWKSHWRELGFHQGRAGQRSRSLRASGLHAHAKFIASANVLLGFSPVKVASSWLLVGISCGYGPVKTSDVCQEL